jgi:hypothetical protein
MMRKISATFIYTLTGPPLKNGIVVADSKGIIKEVIDTGGIVSEISGLEFYSGLLAPGFVNALCYIKLSHFDVKIQSGIGYSLEETARLRNTDNEASHSPIPDLPGTNKLFLIKNRYLSSNELKNLEELRLKNKPYLILCPKSILSIENHLPDIKLLQNSGFPICIGTHSLASKQNQSMMEELKAIQQNCPVPIDVLLTWSCKNGAEALGINNWAGTIEVGKSPGINLISGVNWKQLFLTPNSKIKKLL